MKKCFGSILLLAVLVSLMLGLGLLPGQTRTIGVPYVGPNGPAMAPVTLYSTDAWDPAIWPIPRVWPRQGTQEQDGVDARNYPDLGKTYPNGRPDLALWSSSDGRVCEPWPLERARAKEAEMRRLGQVPQAPGPDLYWIVPEVAQRHKEAHGIPLDGTEGSLKEGQAAPARQATPRAELRAGPVVLRDRIVRVVVPVQAGEFKPGDPAPASHPNYPASYQPGAVTTSPVRQAGNCVGGFCPIR